jgi:hypothetical protein
MNIKIENCTTCAVQSVAQFANAKKYGEGAVNEVQENVFTFSKEARQRGAVCSDPYTCITQTVQSEVFEHPPYSHDLEPSDYYVFLIFRNPPHH